jgi:hypothetical protein
MLGRRVSRLERELGGRPCPGCSGKPLVIIYHLFDEETPHLPQCRLCGRERFFLTVRAPKGAPPIRDGLRGLLRARDLISPGIQSLMEAGGSTTTAQIWGGNTTKPGSATSGGTGSRAL